MRRLWKYIDSRNKIGISELMGVTKNKRLRLTTEIDLLKIDVDANGRSLFGLVGEAFQEQHRYFQAINDSKIVNSDSFVISKGLEGSKRKKLLHLLENATKKGCVCQSNRFKTDTCIVINNSITWLPLYHIIDNTVSYARVEGKEFLNALTDVEIGDICAEIPFLKTLSYEGAIGTDYVKCPVCELNYILEGEECCSVCEQEAKNVRKADMKSMVPIKIGDIFRLWCKLLGKDTNGKADFYMVKGALLANKSIRRTKNAEKYDVCDKTDVFREFFCAHKIIGSFVTQKGICTFDELAQHGQINTGNAKSHIKVKEVALEKPVIEKPIFLVANNGKTVILYNIKTKKRAELTIDSHRYKQHKVFHGKKKNELVEFNGKSYLILEIKSRL